MKRKVLLEMRKNIREMGLDKKSEKNLEKFITTELKELAKKRGK